MKSLGWTIVVALALIAAGCVDRGAQAQAKRTEKLLSDPVQPVQVAPAVTRELVEQLEITGTISTVDNAPVGAKVGGRIVAVYVQDGDQVSAGQVIASQEATDAREQVQRALAELRVANAALQQALSNARLGPQKSESAVRSAEAQLRQARAQLEKLRAGARPEERAQSKAAVEAAKVNMETARKDLDRAREMYAAGAVSRQRLDQAENAYSAALAQYEQALQSWNLMQAGARSEDIAAAEQSVGIAEEAVRTARANQKLDVVLDQQVQAARAQVQAREAELRVARQAVMDREIRSPFAGKVSGQPAKVGSYAGPGTVVARIVSTAGIYFEGEVPEVQLPKLRVGQSVDVVVDALGTKRFDATIAAIDPLGSDVGRLFRIRVELRGSAPGVRPGMFARGSVVLDRIPNAVVVPSDAIVRSRDGAAVFVVEGGKAKRVPVTIGLVQDGMTQVTGVESGREVIVVGQTSVVDGTAVRIEKNETQSEASSEGKE